MRSSRGSWALVPAIVTLAAAACGLSLDGTTPGPTEIVDGSVTDALSSNPPGDDANTGNDGSTSDGNSAADGNDGGDAGKGEGGGACDPVACGNVKGMAGSVHGQCDAGVCVITCAGKNDCRPPGGDDRPKCPAGHVCDVTCGNDACDQGVDCKGAASCTIHCQGNNACGPNNAVECGAASCNVACSGQDSCKSAVSCGAANVLIACTGTNACTGPVTGSTTAPDGKGPVEIDCRGQGSCKGVISSTGSVTVQCNADGGGGAGGAACASKVNCTGSQSACAIHCGSGVDCKVGACCQTAGTCSVDPDASTACP